jgi:hypothetical protein
MRAGLVPALLIMAVAGEARAQAADSPGFCTTFRQLLGAASERPAFGSLGRRGPARAAAGLGFDTCRIAPDLYGNRLVCTRAGSPPLASGATAVREIAACVPEALGMSEPEGSLLTRFRLGTLAFHVRRDPRTISFTLFAMPVER